MMTRCLKTLEVDLVVIDSQVELVHQVVSRVPDAVVVGVGPGSEKECDVIGMIHAVKVDLPVIVIASADSIELERRARQAGIFYYVVEPPQEEELEAVIDDVLRYTAEGH